MLNIVDPAIANLKLTFGQAFVPLEHLPALDREGRDAPMFFHAVNRLACQEGFVANDFSSLQPRRSSRTGCAAM
jgi:hypothetical protein